MSIIGANSGQSLNDLLAAKNDKAALSLIKKGGIDLKEIDTSGLSPIHWAATHGFKKVFEALVKRGVSPFTPDQDGYAPYYHACTQQKEEFLEFFHKNYPFDFSTDITLTSNQEVDEALRNCGLHSFSVKLPVFEQVEESDTEKGFIDDKKKPVAVFLRSLFSSVAIESNKRKSTLLKLDIKSEPLTEITSSLLSQMAYGLTEEMPPLDIIKILTKDYKNMAWEEKLSCLYFVKELIRIDNKNEWIKTPEFKKALDKFLNTLGDTPAVAAAKSKIKKLYNQKINPSRDYHKSVTALTFDLAKAFTEVTTQLTPQNFLAVNMLKNAKDNSALQAVSELTNKLSQVVCMDILCAPSSKKALKRYRFYLDAIKLCLKENASIQDKSMPYNFAAAFAIYNGLQFNALQRLECINQALSSEDRQALVKFDTLFSNQGSFRGLRDLTAQFPKCIPLIAIYSGDKDKISENAQITDRIVLFGKLNQQFSQHFNYLCTLEHLSITPYKTNFMERLDKLVYSDTTTYWYSYQLEPAKIICLDEALDLQNLEVMLKFCKDIHAPLVVEQASKRYFGHDARKMLTKHLESQTTQQGSIEMLDGLCKLVIKNFNADAPKSEQTDVLISALPKRKSVRPSLARKHREVLGGDTISGLTENIQKLSLLETEEKDEKQTPRPRANTTSLGTAPRREQYKNKTGGFTDRKRALLPMPSPSAQADTLIPLETISETAESLHDSFSGYTPLASTHRLKKKSTSSSSKSASNSEDTDVESKKDKDRSASKKALERK